MIMKIEIADYVELADGGAVVIFEMDEETRTSLISEAIKRRLIEGLERMADVPEKDGQADIEGYLKDLADMEAREGMDTMESSSQSSGS
jgi:hypothetical protein